MNPLYTCPHCAVTRSLAHGQRFCSNCQQPLDGAVRRPPVVPAPLPNFAAPAMPAPLPTLAVPVVPYESGQLRARVSISLLAIGIVLGLLAIVSDLLDISLLSAVLADQTVSEIESNINDLLQGVVALLQLGVYLASGISFLLWFRRAYRNLPDLGIAYLQYTPNWAVGGFFVPFLNLVRPYRIMKELWQASSATGDFHRNVGWQVIPPPKVLGWWWGAWLLSGMVDRMATQVSRTDKVSTLMTADWLTIVATVISGVAAALLIWLIREIDRLQTARRQEMAAAVPLPAQAPLGVPNPYTA